MSGTVTCTGCHRAFAQDRIAIHERVCTKVAKENTPKSARARAAARAGAMSAKIKANPLQQTQNVYAPNPNSAFYKAPKKRKAQFVFCYICGRQFTGKLEVYYTYTHTHTQLPRHPYICIIPYSL